MDVNFGKSFLAPLDYKSRPLYPLPSEALDFKVSNVVQPRPACSDCFPQKQHLGRASYIDLFEIPNFGGLPYPLAPGASTPWRFAADLRYTWKTPLPHKYPSVKKELLDGDRINNLIAVQLAKNPKDEERSIRKKAVSCFYEIRATLNRVVCKLCGYLLFKIFRRLMTRLLVNPAQMKELQDAEKTGIPLVYLPLHRSHLDYLMITWNSWHWGLQLPHIASGDNLNLSGFGWLLRSTGAFFIRRRLDDNDASGKDDIYRYILRAYIEEVLGKKLAIEFFLEGTRNRFGKALLPKNGLISNVVEAVQRGTLQDVYLVPVSYSYDQVPEGVFLNELMGNTKQRESIFGVFRAIWKGFGVSQRCGAVRMHYGKPVLLSDYLRSLADCSAIRSAHPPKQLTRLPQSYSYRELVPWTSSQSSAEYNRALIRSIGFHVVYEAQDICSTSAVSIVASLLLSKYRNGVPRSQLADDCLWLTQRILANGGDVIGWRSGTSTGVLLLQEALQYLEASVNVAGNQISIIRTHRQLIHLAYAKNGLVFRFSLQAALALVLTSHDPSQPIPYYGVIEKALLLCDWMQNEVMFAKPCESLRKRLMTTLGREGMSCPFSGTITIDEDEAEMGGGDVPAKIKISTPRHADELMFYSNFLRPFAQTLYIVLQRLTVTKEPIREIDFTRQLIQRTLARPAYDFPFELMVEAINSDSIKNCLRTMRVHELIPKEGQLISVLQPEALTEALTFIQSLLKVHLQGK